MVPTPTWCLPGAQIHDHAMTVARVPAHKYYYDAELLVDTQLAVERCTGSTPSPSSPMLTTSKLRPGRQVYLQRRRHAHRRHLRPLIKEPGDLDKVGSLDVTKGRIRWASRRRGRSARRRRASSLPLFLLPLELPLPGAQLSRQCGH